MVEVTGHLPDRPSWDCLACDNPWPCVAARRELTAEYAGASVALMIYMFSQHSDAVTDIGERVTAADLYRRFLGWPGAPSLA